MTLWDEHNEKKAKADKILDGSNLILFFTKNKAVYGAPEESRLVFAKMKHPDEEVPENWANQASFSAFDLMRAMTGEKIENLFSCKDLDDIKVIDRDEAWDMLMTQKDKKGPEGLKINGGNEIKLKDRKK